MCSLLHQRKEDISKNRLYVHVLLMTSYLTSKLKEPPALTEKLSTYLHPPSFVLSLSFILVYKINLAKESQFTLNNQLTLHHCASVYLSSSFA